MVVAHEKPSEDVVVADEKPSEDVVVTKENLTLNEVLPDVDDLISNVALPLSEIDKSVILVYLILL